MRQFYTSFKQYLFSQLNISTVYNVYITTIWKMIGNKFVKRTYINSSPHVNYAYKIRGLTASVTVRLCSQYP